MHRLLPLAIVALLSVPGCSFGITGQEPASAPKSTVNLNPSTQEERNQSKAKGAALTLRKTYTGFQAPTGLAVDHSGNLYVSNWSGGSVTKVDIAGNYSTFADGLGSPAGLAFDHAENLYIADYARDVIYRVTPAGEKILFAQGLHTPTGIAFNHTGDLLVSNRSSNEIVKITDSGKMELVAKGMRTPVGVVEDNGGNLYVTNYGGDIIKVTPEGVSSTLSTHFGRPGVGIDISRQNTIFAADNGDGCVRRLAPDGSTEIVADNISGCVALLVHEDTLYVGGWNEGAVYVYSIH
jgi:sugar lactone lactonase YvrE